MEKELCLKFLVHLYKYSQTMLAKPRIEEVDVVYINNEVDNFRKRLDREETKEYDKLGALDKVATIPLETVGDKAVNASLFLVKAKFKVLSLLTGSNDDAHRKRFEKISAFNEDIRKIIALLEYA